VKGQGRRTFINLEGKVEARKKKGRSALGHQEDEKNVQGRSRESEEEGADKLLEREGKKILARERWPKTSYLFRAGFTNSTRERF